MAMKRLFWISILSLAAVLHAGKRQASLPEKRPLPKITDLVPGCDDNTHFCLKRCDTTWYEGDQTFMGTCAMEQKYNRYNPSCYNQYLNLALHYVLDAISYEVHEDVKACENGDEGIYTMYSEDLRFSDPDYLGGSNKYCQEGLGVTTWEERSEWLTKVEKYKTACDFGLLGCKDEIFDDIMGQAAFYSQVFDALAEETFSITNLMSAEPVYQKKPLNIQCGLYYDKIDPLFSGWVPPTPRNPEQPVCNVALPSPLQYSIDYSNDLIRLTVNPQFANGQCAQIVDAIFWAESEGSDVVYAPAGNGCNPVTFQVGYGIGNFDAVNKYYWKSVTEWKPTLLDWTRTTTTKQRNNYTEATLTYYYPAIATCDSPRTRKIKLNVPSSTFSGSYYEAAKPVPTSSYVNPILP